MSTTCCSVDSSTQQLSIWSGCEFRCSRVCLREKRVKLSGVGAGVVGSSWPAGSTDSADALLLHLSYARQSNRDSLLPESCRGPCWELPLLAVVGGTVHDVIRHCPQPMGQRLVSVKA